MGNRSDTDLSSVPTWGCVVVFYVLLGLAALDADEERRQEGKPASRARRLTRDGAWWLLAAWIMPGWWLAGAVAADATLEADFLAVGHGLAVLIHMPDGQTWFTIAAVSVIPPSAAASRLRLSA